jgi:hypothetical protein
LTHRYPLGESAAQWIERGVMKSNPTKLAKDLLKDLIRDAESAVDLIGNLCDQADADGDSSTASVLRAVSVRLFHVGDELKTAEAVVMSVGGRQRRPSRQPVR